MIKIINTLKLAFPPHMECGDKQTISVMTGGTLLKTVFSLTSQGQCAPTTVSGNGWNLSKFNHVQIFRLFFTSLKNLLLSHKNDMTSKTGFVLSKRPYLHSAYLLRVWHSFFWNCNWKDLHTVILTLSGLVAILL